MVICDRITQVIMSLTNCMCKNVHCMLVLNAYLGQRQAKAIQVTQMTTEAGCAHVCVWKACDSPTDGVTTSAEREWTSEDML